MEKKALREWRKLFNFKLIFPSRRRRRCKAGVVKYLQSNRRRRAMALFASHSTAKCERGTQTEKPNDLLSSEKSLLTYIFFAMLNTKVLVAAAVRSFGVPKTRMHERAEKCFDDVKKMLSFVKLYIEQTID